MTWNELCKKTPVFKIINIFIIIVLSMGFTYWLYGYLEGDSAIYFTYYKNFFDLPFSFSDKTVSFGATSPLYVVLNSFIYKLSGKYWLELCKFFSIFMFFLSAHIVACSMAENNSARIIIESIVNVILLLFCGDFIIYTSTCFETGLILLSVSLLITLDLRHEYNKAIVVSGFLYLVRPELILLTIIYDSYYLIKRKNRETFLRICVSGAPVAAYVIYMFLFTKQLLPSSIAGRFITSIEEPWSYSEKLDYFLSFICGKLKYLIFLTICAMVFAFIKKQWTLLRNTLFVLCPLFLPYIFFPPTNYRGLRYITPILTVIIMAANFLVNYVLIKIKDQKIYWIICFLALLYLGGVVCGILLALTRSLKILGKG